MAYLILILLLVVVGIGSYFYSDQVIDYLRGSVFRQRDHVRKELDDMFIFISLEGLQTLKWCLSLGLAGIGVLLTWDATPMALLSVSIVLGVAGYWTPELVLIYLRRRRRAMFSEQLVDGLVLMSNGLRSGFDLKKSIQMLVDEMPAPISQEFDLALREISVNTPIETALRNCVRRTQDADLDLVVTAVEITRQLGGNLAEVFDRIVAMVRERKILSGKADALTSEGKLQALVVGLLPYGFGFALVKINPDIMSVMWTTLPGFVALGMVVILDVIGYLWVRKLAMIEY